MPRAMVSQIVDHGPKEPLGVVLTHARRAAVVTRSDRRYVSNCHLRSRLSVTVVKASWLLASSVPARTTSPILPFFRGPPRRRRRRISVVSTLPFFYFVDVGVGWEVPARIEPVRQWWGNQTPEALPSIADTPVQSFQPLNPFDPFHGPARPTSVYDGHRQLSYPANAGAVHSG